MKYFIPICFLLFSVQVFGQDHHFYGGCGDEEAQKILCVGNYRYLAGTTSSHYNPAIYIVKTDTSGNVIWSKGLLGAGYVSGFISIAPDRLMILRNYGNSDLFTLDTAGNIIRSKHFSGMNAYTLDNYFDKIVVTGSIIMTPCIAILDTASVWQMGMSYSLAGGTTFVSPVVEPDSSLQCVFEANSNNIGIVKINSNLSADTVKEINAFNEFPTHIIPSMDNGYFISAWGNPNVMVLAKADSAGNILWKRNYSSTSSVFAASPNICFSPDSSSLLLTTTTFRIISSNQHTTCSVLRVDTTGIVEYFYDYGDTAYSSDNYSPEIALEGNKVVCFATTTSDTAANAMVSAGIQANFLVFTFDTALNSSLVRRSLPVTVSSSSNVPMYAPYTVVSSPFTGSMTYVSGTMINMSSSVDSAAQCIDLSVAENVKEMFKVFPNPNNGEFTIQMDRSTQHPIQVKIYTSLGELVFSEQHASREEIHIKYNNQTPGLYFVEIISGEEVTWKKMEMVR